MFQWDGLLTQDLADIGKESDFAYVEEIFFIVLCFQLEEEDVEQRRLNKSTLVLLLHIYNL